MVKFNAKDKRFTTLTCSEEIFSHNPKTVHGASGVFIHFWIKQLHKKDKKRKITSTSKTFTGSIEKTTTVLRNDMTKCTSTLPK